MTDPVDYAAYMKRFYANDPVDEFGVGDVYITMPCPFCAAPGWMLLKVGAIRPRMAEGATCTECGRSAMVAFESGGVSFEMVQTGGSDPPDYLPKMRRAS